MLMGMENRKRKVEFPFLLLFPLTAAHTAGFRNDPGVLVSIPSNTVYIDHHPEEGKRYQVLSAGRSV